MSARTADAPRPERVRVCVIGAGVVGCAVTMELARRGYEPLLLERAHDVGEGASKANSAIVHTGFDARPGTIEADLLARARPLWPSLVQDLGVPFLRVGALMLATNSDEGARLRGEVASHAGAQGVPVEVLDEVALRRVAPWVTPAAVAALLVPDEAIVDPFWLTRSYAEAAVQAGATVRLGAEVVGLEAGRGQMRVALRDGSLIDADQVVNCAGLAADGIAAMAGDDGFTIGPRKGQFLVSEEAFGVDRITLPIPGPMGKGMLVTPIIFGGLLLGPTAEDQRDKDDQITRHATREVILRAARALVPAVAAARPIRAFAGLRTVSSTGDYIIAPSPRDDRLFHVAGIRSTGISASPAIAVAVTDEVAGARGWRSRPAGRPRAQAPREISEGGMEVVCLCRSISAPEIAAALRGPLPATTLDGLKRRCGVTFGDCQGNLCVVGAARALAATSGVPLAAVTRRGPGSWLFRERDGGAEGATGAVGAAGAEGAVGADVIVIGAGLAGIGAALATFRAGLRALVVERRASAGGAATAYGLDLTPTENEALRAFEALVRDGQVPLIGQTTVTGIERSPAGWVVLAQGAGGDLELNAPRVVMATGGYVEPAEHLGLDGPRPAGIVSADLVHAALAAGVLPGTSAVVVGAGRTAAATTRALDAAGCRVTSGTTEDPLEVRGDGRLEAVRTSDGWIAVDTLVLCRRLLPQPFLLRGLGLLDATPGRPAPADEDGHVAAGLWAAGTCVAADIDHRRSLAHGALVGAASIADMATVP